MHSRNQWGGSYELSGEVGSGYETSRTAEWDRAALLVNNGQSNHLDETMQSWVLERPESMKKKNKYVDFGCIVLSHKALKWIFGSIFIAFCVVGLPIIIAKSLPKHHSKPAPPDNYTLALRKALLFFNAQKCMYTCFSLHCFFFSHFAHHMILLFPHDHFYLDDCWIKWLNLLSITCFSCEL